MDHEKGQKFPEEFVRESMTSHEVDRYCSQALAQNPRDPRALVLDVTLLTSRDLTP